jgi:hypothetical protein
MVKNSIAKTLLFTWENIICRIFWTSHSRNCPRSSCPWREEPSSNIGMACSIYHPLGGIVHEIEFTIQALKRKETILSSTIRYIMLENSSSKYWLRNLHTLTWSSPLAGKSALMFFLLGGIKPIVYNSWETSKKCTFSAIRLLRLRINQ